MPTAKQRIVVKKTLENLGRPKGDILREVGYSETVAKTPKIVFESKGYKEALDEYGLTEELIVCALVEDITLKKQNRKPELELGAKIRGMLVEKSEVTGKDGGPIEFTGIEVSFIEPEHKKSA